MGEVESDKSMILTAEEVHHFHSIEDNENENVLPDK